MEQTIQDFFHDFKQDLLAGAEASSSFQLSQFVETVAHELMDTGFLEGFELCHYRAQRGMRVDGYWFNDEGALDLFVADFDCREELASLTGKEIDSAFKRVAKFFEASKSKGLFKDLEETAPEYGLSRQIYDRGRAIRKVNFYLFSERALSGRVNAIEDGEVSGVPVSYHIWDVSRLQRQQSSRGHKEILDINFPETYGAGISCLPAHLGSDTYKSYLIVIPATILSSMYEKYGARLLEQNVRCFLQARGNVNKGIRSTIINEPQMFFAYNNGITATAQEVEVRQGDAGLEVVRMKDLQVVNGGQTTASLFHTSRKDKASLEGIFVQMKLSVIDSEQSEVVVPRISEYANTQNRVNAADFFSNHPFHIRMEEFSRRIWAPAQQGALRETKWFYERARGQYADAQSKLTQGEKKKFQAENPKPQMFTKTDLAKFENVWDENPRFVNLGAQKNFAQYAKRIGSEWEKSSEGFNEFYYKRAIARAILFRKTEKLVSAQPWYNGGYRANIVAYTLALLGDYVSTLEKSIDFMRIWNMQFISNDLERVLEITSELVHDEITRPQQGISNVTEWCKKEGCWQRLKENSDRLGKLLPHGFKDSLVSKEAIQNEKKQARKVQKMDDGIEAQKTILKIAPKQWTSLLLQCSSLDVFTEKELEIVRIATQIPKKIPTEKQSKLLIETLKKAESEGVVIN
ncbi:AIPR family protein [Pseudoalteromonas piscicida]|uniref:AIPR family protein n=1 Tax=Pseudoalteromonas piscicida TaxID=43662 RepID=UPI001D0A0F18|nr:AIPR family protein [Pseudoalteromonas piscicida]UDM62727.1 AIPR family protein [Pseudoalteromonas piscicida]